VFKFELSELRAQALRVLNPVWRGLAGLAFMVVAMAAIQYDERIAPEVTRLNHSLDGVTADLRTKLASFTL